MHNVQVDNILAIAERSLPAKDAKEREQRKASWKVLNPKPCEITAEVPFFSPTSRTLPAGTP